MGDYDRKPMEPPSVWLKLKHKDQEIRIRIAATPYRELKVWPAEQGGSPLGADVTSNLSSGQWMRLMANPDWNVTEIYHFLVIDRADSSAKIFTTTGGVYGKIRNYATDPEWGNPTTYDIRVKRTEQPGKNYYELTPSPNKSDLMQAELEKIDAINLGKLLPAALPAGAVQPDDFDPGTLPEALPWEAPLGAAPRVPAAEQRNDYVDPEPAALDKVFGDINTDEPISLDDIPFDDDQDMSEKGSKK